MSRLNETQRFTKGLPVILPVEGVVTRIELVSFMSIPNRERAHEVRRSLMGDGYSCSEVISRETPQGRLFVVHGSKTDHAEVVL